jgi:hypothetical protein
MDHVGYRYITKVDHFFVANEETKLLAKCQRLALLGHCALVTGIILKTKSALINRYELSGKHSQLFLKLGLSTYLSAILLNGLNTLQQVAIPLLCVSAVCSAYLLIKGLADRKILFVLTGGLGFSIHLLNATLTGYKEAIVVNFIFLAFIGFSYFKNWVIMLTIPSIVILLYTLPTFTAIFRTHSWLLKKSVQEARTQAYQTLIDNVNAVRIEKNNWDFLVNRSSEIGMFKTYVRQVPEWYAHDLEALENSIHIFFPRILWKEKPSMERLAMERVYKAGVVSRSSVVSAKSRPVVDGYLTAGMFGIFVYLFLYGAITQAICNQAESYFGGYQLGCVIMFNSIFQPLWRGNAFEFVVHNVFYGWLLMILLHKILVITKTLWPIHENHSHNPVL